jgi:hypothetical protein
MEILRFLKWGWAGLEVWQRMFILAVSLQGIALFFDKHWAIAISGLGMLILIVYLSKWAFIDPLKSSWSRYKAHRNALLTKIKNSDV